MRLIKSYQRQQGVTLIEILVALGVSILLLGAAAAVGLSSLSTSKEGITNGIAQQALQSSLSTITREFRRAGYSSLYQKNGDGSVKTDAAGIAISVTEPNKALFKKIWFFGGTATTEHDCVVFFYDKLPDGNGFIAPGDGVRDSGDMRGIRINTTSKKLEILTSATVPGTDLTACPTTGWESIMGNGLSLETGVDGAGKKLSRINYSNPVAFMDTGILTINEVELKLTAKSKNGTIYTRIETVQLRNYPTP